MKYFRKKIYFIIILSVFLPCLSEMIYADDSSEEKHRHMAVRANDDRDRENIKKVIGDANNYIKDVYGKIVPSLQNEDYYPFTVEAKDTGKKYEANYSYYRKYGLIVYWNGEDLASINGKTKDICIAKCNDSFYTKDEKIYRYIGYDLYGEKLYNPYFPADNLVKNPKGGLKNLSEDDSDNKIWSEIRRDNEELKKHIMGNLEKSLDKGFPQTIDLYFNHRNVPKAINESYADLKDTYKQNYREYFDKIFKEDQSSKIKLVTLPTEKVHGFARYINTHNYYGTVLLEYQEKLDASVEVRHVTVEVDKNDRSKYKVSDHYYPINSVGNYYTLKQGETRTFKAKEISTYTCLGYAMYKDENVYNIAVGSEEDRKYIKNIVPFKEVTYKHEYQSGNDRPLIVFFYEKTGNLDVDKASGNIIVSSDKYHVSRAIPSDKNVKITVNTDSRVLANYTYNREEEMTSIGVYSRERVETEDENGKIKRGFENFLLRSIKKPFSYYKIYDYLVYNFKGAKVNNPKLSPLNPVFIPAKNIGKTKVKPYTKHLGRISIPSYIRGHRCYTKYNKEDDEYQIIIANYEGDYLDESELDAIIYEIEDKMKLRVRNDYLKIDGQVILDNRYFDGINPPEPVELKKRAVRIVKDPHHIGDKILNGDSETDGKLLYEKIKDSSKEHEEEREFDIVGNNVFIHTPAVNRTVFRKDEVFDQRIADKRSGMAVPLDHIMKLDIFTDFEHINEKGYKYRDYEKEIKLKTVTFDFDVYASTDKKDLEKRLPDKKFYLKKGEILKVNPDFKAVYYKAASWADLGKHSIITACIAKNAPLVFNAEKNANLNYQNYAAFNKKELYLTGRLYDFRIDKILDNGYLSSEKDSYYSTGLNDKNGVKRDRFQTLKDSEIEALIYPVTAGKSPIDTALNRDLKMGYPFIFSIKSMGSFYAENDIISLKPKFYHIDNKGNIDENIELYYRNKGKLIKLGSDDDSLNQRIVYRDVADLEDFFAMKKTSDILKEKSGKEGILDFSKYDYKVSKPIFSYKPSLSVLSYPFRTFVASVDGIPEGVNPSDVMMSEQKWKGVYALPASTLAFKVQDAKVDLTKPLKSGKIAVYFDIMLSRDNNKNGGELVYVSDLANEYINEGYIEDQGGTTYPLGTAVLYSLEHSADDDLREE